MKYHFKIHKEGSGYWAQGIELKGCITQGASFEELEINMRDALETYLDEPKDSKDIIPLPDSSVRLSKSVIESL